MKMRGTSLIELLISCGLLSICLAGVFLLVSAGSRYLRMADDQTEMQRETIFALNWMVRDTSESDPSSIGNQTTSNLKGFWVASPRDPSTGKVTYDVYGRMLWGKFVAYYQSTQANGTPVLMRCWQSSTDPSTGNAWVSPPSIASIDAVVNGAMGNRLVARNVQNLAVNVSTTGAPSQISIQCGLTSGMGKNYAIQAQSSVYCRN
jgi:hypothetical protein